MSSPNNIHSLSCPNPSFPCSFLTPNTFDTNCVLRSASLSGFSTNSYRSHSKSDYFCPNYPKRNVKRHSLSYNNSTVIKDSILSKINSDSMDSSFDSRSSLLLDFFASLSKSDKESSSLLTTASILYGSFVFCEFSIFILLIISTGYFILKMLDKAYLDLEDKDFHLFFYSHKTLCCHELKKMLDAKTDFPSINALIIENRLLFSAINARNNVLGFNHGLLKDLFQDYGISFPLDALCSINQDVTPLPVRVHDVEGGEFLYDLNVLFLFFKKSTSLTAYIPDNMQKITHIEIASLQLRLMNDSLKKLIRHMSKTSCESISF